MLCPIETHAVWNETPCPPLQPKRRPQTWLRSHTMLPRPQMCES